MGAVGAQRLPSHLAEALDAMEASELVRTTLGDHVFQWFLRNKRDEWDRFQRHVSRFELENYLPCCDHAVVRLAAHPSPGLLKAWPSPGSTRR